MITMSAKARYELFALMSVSTARTLNRVLGTQVEVCIVDATTTTISGSTADAQKAAAWLQTRGLMFLTDEVYDKELATHFCYMNENPA